MVFNNTTDLHRRYGYGSQWVIYWLSRDHKGLRLSECYLMIPGTWEC